MTRNTTSFITLVLVLSLGSSLAAKTSNETPSDQLTVAVYDLPLIQRALEDQAWVVMYAAAEHASENDGTYPERVDEFAHRLPRGERMANVWTGELAIPSEQDSEELGSVVYRPMYWHGHVVGCQIVATGRYGERVVLVSDLGWWKQNQDSVVVSASN